MSAILDPPDVRTGDLALTDADAIEALRREWAAQPPQAAPKADTNDRRTPRWFVDQCERRYGRFRMDVAAICENAVCIDWLGPGSPIAEDALAWHWSEQNFCNPPYGPPGTIEKWIAKAREQRALNGSRTLMLLPADTSTKWYHDVARTELIELVPFRLAFEAPDGSTKGNSAKFGSVLVWIAPRIHRPKAERDALIAQEG